MKKHMADCLRIVLILWIAYQFIKGFIEGVKEYKA